MKTAILGGSFDPVHNGHLELARTVLDRFDYDRILFIPAGNPPHKHLSGHVEDSRRLEMLRDALSGEDGMDIWDGELKREGRSYSIDTVRELKQKGLVGSRPGLIIGDDLVRGFPTWKESEKLAREAEILLARRLEEPPSELPFPCRTLNNELWPYSSTELRAIIGRGGDISRYVPAGVATCIMENGLYGYPG